MRPLFRSLAVVIFALVAGESRATADSYATLQSAIAARPGQTAAMVLDGGLDALIARGWLADNARRSIEVQYFIWSSDNVGVIATEALLRAAERGVHVRVIVDDMLIDAPDESLLALDRHPNIEIRIYNPKHHVGTTLKARALNAAIDFRGSNQRMHDKVFIVDGEVAITGGRNMADEYFDHDHAYNFRDRDALLAGAAVKTMQESFEHFWVSPFAAPVEHLYDGFGILQKNVDVRAAEVRRIYRDLHEYAAKPTNFAPEVRAAIDGVSSRLPAILDSAVWGRVDFLSDLPGKNDGRSGLGGGGRTTSGLAALLSGAREEVLIQSPYVVLSDEALARLRELRRRGVRIRISTNSLASTDNLQAFSGYRSQRKLLLEMGLDIREYRPNPAEAVSLMRRYRALRKEAPVFALHAKSMVIDRKVVCIGTFNLDPRSQNLNTEVAAVIHDATVAESVARAIETDMKPVNSWSAAADPDQFATAGKRAKVRFWQVLPIKPLL